MLAKIDAATPCRYGAPTVLVVAFNKDDVFVYPGEKRDSGVEDATIVATHMILAAYNAGVDSCWLNFFNPDELAASLGLPENEEILMLMDLGYAPVFFSVCIAKNKYDRIGRTGTKKRGVILCDIT